MKDRFSFFYRNPIFHRWVDLVILSAFIAVTVVALKQPLVKMVGWWDGLWPHHQNSVFYCSVVLSAATVSFILIRLGALHGQYELRTMCKYPPVWISPILVFFTVAVISKRDVGIFVSWIKGDASSILFTSVAVLAGILLGCGYEKLEKCRSLPARAGTREEAGRGYLLDNNEDLLAWILDETPITHPDHDVLGHVIPAKRVARLLLKDAPSSVGIVGPYGSGKSSLLNLVDYFLSNTQDLGQKTSPLFSGKIVICRVDGWGRVSGTVAQKILALAIEEVRQHVDCLSIVSMPEAYRKAIAGATTTGGAVISALLQASHDPVAQLSKLDQILAAANIRLVIFLEDLDRNIDNEIMADEMPSLLDRLRCLGQVSFVLAIGSERKFSQVLIRICDHVEAVS